jgi:UDP-N-acetylmuramate dehydrogenase
VQINGQWNPEVAVPMQTENVSLSDKTTIGLGGPARHFAVAESVEKLRTALQWANEKRIPAMVLGGGSNVVFSDRGFAGLIVQLGFGNCRRYPGGRYLTEAGLNWDKFVSWAVSAGDSGVECLSGIPGALGAAPVQNIGAYGQEVKNTIRKVWAIEATPPFSTREFALEECGFDYRTSRFKAADRGKFVITQIEWQLTPNGGPCLDYADLANLKVDLSDKPRALQVVREAVIAIRRKKSMVIDPADGNSRSCGSFFVNPTLSRTEFAEFERRAEKHKPYPVYWNGDRAKVPAAWLIERAGFRKGQTQEGVGISSNHALALVNHRGTTAALIKFARAIRDGVHKEFGVTLAAEPEIFAETGELHGLG